MKLKWEGIKLDKLSKISNIEVAFIKIIKKSNEEDNKLISKKIIKNESFKNFDSNNTKNSNYEPKKNYYQYQPINLVKIVKIQRWYRNVVKVRYN